jgi:hypothetical protein
VVGSRLDVRSNTSRRVYRTILSRSYNFLARQILHTRTRDLQCGFKGIRRSVYKTYAHRLHSNHWFFDTQLIVWGERLGYRIAEIPVRWKERAASKVKIVDTTTGYVRDLFRLRKELQQAHV